MTTTLQDRGDGVLTPSDIIEPAFLSDAQKRQRDLRRMWRHERAEAKQKLAVEVQKARESIPVQDIVDRLARNAIGELLEGEEAMTAMEITAAVKLLAKVMPDLTSMEIKGDVAHYVVRLPVSAADAESWSKQHAPKALPSR